MMSLGAGWISTPGDELCSHRDNGTLPYFLSWGSGGGFQALPVAESLMSNCKECGGAVKWVQNGRHWQCFNPDGSVHWGLCSKRRWDQTVSTGERFVEKNTSEGIASGYQDSIHGTKNETLRGKPIRGKRYKPNPACKKCVPPWEICPNKCPSEFRA